jgi:hypothetical protein
MESLDLQPWTRIATMNRSLPNFVSYETKFGMEAGADIRGEGCPRSESRFMESFEPLHLPLRLSGTLPARQPAIL